MKVKFYLQRDTKKREIVGDRRIYCYIYDTPESYEVPTREKVSGKNWDKKKCRPITTGYKNKDEQREMKALSNYLNSFEKGLGKNTISNYIKVKPQTYEYEVEPYLVYKELVIVDSRRKITDKGKELLNGMGQKEKNQTF